MRQRILFRGLFCLCAAIALSQPAPTPAIDDYVYNNLLKSRDALLAQQAELQRAYDETRAKLDRIDKYLKQVNASIRDVDDTLRTMGR